MKFVATFKTDEGIDKTFEIGENIGLDDAYRVVANNHLTTQSIEINPNMDYTRKMHLGGDMSKHLAPNGKPSNLNHEQWHMVRSQEFKNWFGDWENDPQNASKVVDENGEPLVCEHKTNSEFYVFDKNKIGSKTDSGYFGKGFYFSPKGKGSLSYGKIKMYVFLNIRTPKYLKSYELSPKNTEDAIIIMGDYDFGQMPAKKLSHEESNEINEIVVFSPNNIKLADGTNTTFDGNNRDIRYKKGGEIDNGKPSTPIHQMHLGGDMSKHLASNGKPSNYPDIRFAGGGQVPFNIHRELNEYADKLPKFGYHGTQSETLINPRPSKDGRYGEGFYLTLDPDTAEYFGRFTKTSQGYSKKNESANVFEFDLRGLNLKYYKKAEDMPYIDFDGLNQKNYDGIYFYYEGEIVIFNIDKLPQGKLVHSKNTNPDLRFAKGGITTSKLKAPNGKPSNLTPQQWKLVRTPQFKAWFGDWENDPQNASKVIDDNGEPLVVYHTTDKDFNYFDIKKSKDGFFFSPQKDRLSVYGKSKMLSFFLNIKNPSHELFKSDITYLTNKGYDGIMDYGYGIKSNESLYEIIAFHPNQIKLADGTNTTFDGNNPDIRYKKGGEMHQPKEENIYMNIKYYTPRDIEEKYKLSETEVGRLIEDGAEHELEHTSDYLLAVRIASSHLYENKDYYKKLKQMKLAMGGVIKHYAKDGLCLSIDNAFADGGKIPNYTKDYFKEMVKKGRMFDKGEYYSDAPFVKSFDYRNFVTFLYDDVAVWLYQEFGILLNEDFSFDYKGEIFIPSVKVADVKDGEVLKFTFIYNAIENDDKITYVVIDDNNNILDVVFDQDDADALAEMKNAYVEVQTEDEPIEKTIGMLQINLKTNEVLFTNKRMGVSESTKYEDGGKFKNMPPKDENGERKIDPKSIEQLTEYVNKLPQTKSKYYNEEINRYSTERRKLHAKIINKYKEDVVCITKGSPIAILMGGSPASGKSSFLKRYSPFLLKSEILKIDADEIRAKLPEYKGYNATQTHMETKDIVNTLISDKNIGIPCDFDLIYDGTMNSVKSYIPLIEMLQNRGYKIFIVYMDNVPKEVITKRILERYQKTGRFVPLEVVDDFFEKGRSAFDALKNQVDGYMVIDGSNQDYNIIQQGGIRLPRTRQYSKIGQKIDKKQFPKEYKKGGKA